MPKPREYLNGYQIRQGMNLAGYTLKSVDLKHETISRYHEYHYPIVMIWEPRSNAGSLSTLVNQLDNHVSKDRVIYTEYGNPYQCHFGDLSHHYQNSNGDVVINSMGVCKRV
ncbi:MAG TPA: hypothetical protein VKR58_00425 [Aquella sp.]|nr:hypothetical protein [Aquella sp.]